MKNTIAVLLFLIMIAGLASATCPANYTADCNLLNQSECETDTYYSNASMGVNRTCTWNIALCEEDASDCDAPTTTTTTVATTTTTVATTTTTLIAGSCDPSEMRIKWSVIGITESFNSECFYYSNGTLIKCFGNNETICLPRNADYYQIVEPNNWNMIDNPVNATTWILGLARPAVGWFFVLFIVLTIIGVFVKYFFGRR